MTRGTKVAIIGAGKVGISAAYTMYLKGTAGEIVLYSKNKEALIGEQLDFQHSLAFLSTTKITIASELADLKNSDVIVFSAGAAQKPGETRLDLAKKKIAN